MASRESDALALPVWTYVKRQRETSSENISMIYFESIIKFEQMSPNNHIVFSDEIFK